MKPERILTKTPVLYPILTDNVSADNSTEMMPVDGGSGHGWVVNYTFGGRSLRSFIPMDNIREVVYSPADQPDEGPSCFKVASIDREFAAPGAPSFAEGLAPKRGPGRPRKS